MNKERIGKIQELIYELSVKDLMKKKVISVPPDMSMYKLREVLRDNRISGVPVVDKGRIVGIISIEDFINWLSKKGNGSCIKDWMTKDVVTVYEDETLIQAISLFEQKGYGRFPVVERKEKKLVGILTKGVIIESLLHEIEVDYHEEEIRHYRASHFFEDIIADSVTIGLIYHVKGGDVFNGGTVASNVKMSLKRLGVKPDIYRRVSIAVYEAEMNLIFYTKGGEISIYIKPDSICINAQDNGPGIPDVKAALQPGFSTAPDWVRELGFGAGIGLNNIQRCSDKMIIDSMVGRGTILGITIYMDV